MRVVVIAFHGVSMFQLTVPSMVFAGDLGPSNDHGYEVRYCAVKPGMIRTDAGFEIKVDTDWRRRRQPIC